MSEEVTSTEELENIIESTEAETAMVPSALTGIVDVSNLSIKEIALVLSKSIGEFKRDTILTPLFVLIETILEILIPFRTANLVDTLRTGAELNAVIQSGAVLAAMAMLSLLFGTLSGISVAKHPRALRAIFAVICSVISKISRLPLLMHSLRHR